MPTPPLVHTDGLTKAYNGLVALDRLDLTIGPGEVFGLLGPNGSGKSTALRLLLGFLRPTAGTARVAGHDCWRDGVQVRRHLAYLPGELRLYENMTGRQVARFLGRLRGQEIGPDFDALARKLDIDVDRPLVQMSSGMKRKVALLTVFVPRVDLVILDEPTNTLDPTMRDELLDQLRQARGRGQSVLFSSHVLAEVEQVCDRVGILRKGRLVHLQRLDDLRSGRRVAVRFARPPESWPALPGLDPPAGGAGDVAFDYSGPLPPLLDWLGRQAVTDLRVGPLGLAGVYRRYHGESA